MPTSAIALSEAVLTSLSFLVMTLDQATMLKPLKRTRLSDQEARILRLQVMLVDSYSLRHCVNAIDRKLRVDNRELLTC